MFLVKNKFEIYDYGICKDFNLSVSHLQGNGHALHFSTLLLFLSPLAESSVSMVMTEHHLLDVETGAHVTRDDLLSVLVDMTSLTVRARMNASADGPIR